MQIAVHGSQRTLRGVTERMNRRRKQMTCAACRPVEGSTTRWPNGTLFGFTTP